MATSLSDSKSFMTLMGKLNNYDIKQYKWSEFLTHEENRGVFVLDRIDQEIGFFVEQRISEYDPDPGAEHLPVGGRVDWVNDKICVEQKKNPSTDNGSSKKQNMHKLCDYAEETGLQPIYAYWQPRKKNDYMKDGVRHLHGEAIFNFLGCGDQWVAFMEEVNSVKMIIKETMASKFDEQYQSD